MELNLRLRLCTGEATSLLHACGWSLILRTLRERVYRFAFFTHVELNLGIPQETLMFHEYSPCMWSLIFQSIHLMWSVTVFSTYVELDLPSYVEGKSNLLHIWGLSTRRRTFSPGWAVFSTYVELNRKPYRSGQRRFDVLRVCRAKSSGSWIMASGRSSSLHRWSLISRHFWELSSRKKASSTYVELDPWLMRWRCLCLPRVCENKFVVYCTCKQKKTYFFPKEMRKFDWQKGRVSLLLIFEENGIMLNYTIYFQLY